jgi:hypothetical protein
MGGENLVSMTLHDLGLRMHLGHGGDPCPIPDGRHVVLISRLGRSTVSVDFCTCGAAEEVQLLEIGWIRADANTCVTLEIFDVATAQ